MIEIPLDRQRSIKCLSLDDVRIIEQRNLVPNFFTFGCGQAFPEGVVCIWADDPQKARMKMIDLFGEKWSFEYDLNGMTRYVKRWEPYLVGEYVV
jgi:hypothetical protein